MLVCLVFLSMPVSFSIWQGSCFGENSWINEWMVLFLCLSLSWPISHGIILITLIDDKPNIPVDTEYQPLSLSLSIILLIVFLVPSSLSSPPLPSSGIGTGGGGAGRVWRPGCLSRHGEEPHVQRTHVRRGGRQALTFSAGDSSWAKNSTPAEEGEDLEESIKERNRNSEVIFTPTRPSVATLSPL